MPIISEENFEEKYWIQNGSAHLEFFPSEGKIVCQTDTHLLKAIHLVGVCNLGVDWTTFKGRTFLIKPLEDYSYKDYLFAVNTFISGMDSKGSVDRKKLLSNNVDNRTGKSLNINTIRVMINTLKKDVKEKRKTRQHIIDFFNRFNIEEDVERKRLGADIMVISQKSVKVLFDEGKGALERLYKKGLLIRLTREEFDEKMGMYGKRK